MQKLANICIRLMLAMAASACTHRQQVLVEVPATIIVHDTVTIVAIQQREVIRYVKDSAYINSIREQYAHHQYEYLRELVKVDSLVALLWDGIGMLIAENQAVAEKAAHLQAAATELQQRLLASVPKPNPYKEVLLAANEPDAKVASRRSRSQQLLAQPRTIYTVGADDAEGEVEITKTCTYEQEMYIAVEVGAVEASEVSATLNGTAALYSLYSYHAAQKGHVFVFPLPKLSGTARLDVLVNGRRNYVVKTSVKNLI
jgi:hypothetical protein